MEFAELQNSALVVLLVYFTPVVWTSAAFSQVLSLSGGNQKQLIFYRAQGMPLHLYLLFLLKLTVSNQ